MRKYLQSFFCVTVSLLAGTSVWAQDSSAGDDSASAATQGGQSLETITVTARKRRESLQDVPVAVAAVSRSELQNNLTNSLDKIAELVPQVSIGQVSSGTGAVITIRGISSSGVDAGLDQSVALDIDGVALSRGRIVQSAQFDLQQVEVLEGPQALFFGKNSPAGVVSLQSADPTSRFESYVKGGYEFEAAERYGEAAVSGPITDTLKARLAFRYDSMNGWIKNNAPAQANPFQPFAPLPGAAADQGTSPKQRDISGRATLLWDPTDDFSARLKITLNGEISNGDAANGDTFCSNGLTNPTMLGVTQTHADCSANMVRTISNLPAVLAVNYPNGDGGVPFLRSNLGLASLTLNKKLGDVTLTSTTGYYDQTHEASFIGDYSEFAQIYDAESEHYELVNEELRANTEFASPVNAMAGAYIEHSHRNWENSPDLLNVFNPIANNYTTSTTTSDSDTDSYSVFAQLRWKILPNLEWAGGARYTHDDKTSSLENFTSNPAAPALGLSLYPDNTPLRAHYTGNNISPETTLTWKPSSAQTLYAAFKTGYKAGGISNAVLLPSTSTAQNLLFGPEKANGFEAGYKADLLQRKLRLDLTAYRYNYNGLQVTAEEPPDFRTTIRNAARARTYGVTGSLEYVATEHLALNGNVGWNRARYLSFPDAVCYTGQTAETGCVNSVQDLTGKPLQRAPNITYKIGADYQTPIVTGWKADLSVSGAYSASYLTATDYSPGGPQDAYWLLDAALHISPDNDRYKLSLIGRNLTNSYYKFDTHTAGIGSPYQYEAFFGRPRELVLQLSYEF